MVIQTNLVEGSFCQINNYSVNASQLELTNTVMFVSNYGPVVSFTLNNPKSDIIAIIGF